MKTILTILFALLFLNCSPSENVNDTIIDNNDQISSYALAMISSAIKKELPLSSPVTSSFNTISSIDTMGIYVPVSSSTVIDTFHTALSSVISSSDTTQSSMDNTSSSSSFNNEFYSSIDLTLSSDFTPTSSSQISSCNTISSSSSMPAMSSELSSSVPSVNSSSLSSETESSSSVITTVTAPEAHNVCITGLHTEGSVLKGKYDYYDLENNPEGTSLFKWYRDGVEISGASDTLYSLTADDIARILTFSVTPIAQNGALLEGGEVTVSDTLYYDNNIEVDGLIDGRDGEKYDIVYIGRQIWMAENLRWLPQVDSGDIGNEDVVGKYFYVQNYQPNPAIDELSQIIEAQQTVEFNTYGVLYSWYAATDTIIFPYEEHSFYSDNPKIIGVCPVGWHLPSDSEWNQMLHFTANETGLDKMNGDDWFDLDQAIKSESDLWAKIFNGRDSVSTSGDNDVMFSSLPGGIRDQYDDGTVLINKKAQYWSASIVGSGQAPPFCPVSFSMDRFGGLVRNTYNYEEASGLSVRCVNDR